MRRTFYGCLELSRTALQGATASAVVLATLATTEESKTLPPALAEFIQGQLANRVIAWCVNIFTLIHTLTPSSWLYPRSDASRNYCFLRGNCERGHLVIGPSTEQPASKVFPHAAPLLEEEGNAQTYGRLQKLCSHPNHIHWSAVRAGFSTDDYPVNRFQVQAGKRAYVILDDVQLDLGPITNFVELKGSHIVTVAKPDSLLT